MTKSFKEALKARRTFYQIENKSTLSDKEIRDLIRFAVELSPQLSILKPPVLRY